MIFERHSENSALDFGGRAIVLRALVGSHNYNLHTVNSDRDWKFFVTPTFDDLYTGKMFSTARQGENDDFDCHDIRQLANLLWKSNINFVEVLHSQDVGYDPRLRWLFENREALSFMNPVAFFNATFGMHLEKMKTLDKGTAKTDVLIEQFGYDTKQACHALRCLLVLGRLARGMSMGSALFFGEHSIDRLALLSIKNGWVGRPQFEDTVEEWKTRLLSETKAWFMEKSANEELKEELDEKIKLFVRDNLNSD